MKIATTLITAALILATGIGATQMRRSQAATKPVVGNSSKISTAFSLVRSDDVPSIPPSASNFEGEQYEITVGVVAVGDQVLEDAGVNLDAILGDKLPLHSFPPSDRIIFNDVVRTYNGIHHVVEGIGRSKTTTISNKAATIWLKNGSNVWNLEFIPAVEEQSAEIDLKIRPLDPSSHIPLSPIAEQRFQTSLGENVVFFAGNSSCVKGPDVSLYIVFAIDHAPGSNGS